MNDCDGRQHHDSTQRPIHVAYESTSTLLTSRFLWESDSKRQVNEILWHVRNKLRKPYVTGKTSNSLRSAKYFEYLNMYRLKGPLIYAQM